MSEPTFQLEPDLSAAEFIDVLRRSTLGERRPIDDPARMEAMLRRADIVATARLGGQLVGVGRALTDFCYCCYLSDLAVDAAHQRRGLGRRLLELVRRTAGEDTRLILIAAPKAVDYYPHVGMTHHPSCWTLP